MAIDRVSGIDATKSPARAIVGTTVPGPVPPASENGPEAVPASGQGAEPQAAELVLGSKTPEAQGYGPTDSYAKVRYDKSSQTVLIQIIDASSGDVIREIPPCAWRKTSETVPLPKGALIEENP